MSAYKHEGTIPCYSIVTKQEPGGDLWAWPVQDTETAAIGQAVKAIFAQYEGEDFVIDKILSETDGSWFIQARSTTNGYPIRPDVNAWVLPTHIGGDDT